MMSDKEFTGVRLFLNIPAEVAHDPRFKSDKSILLFGEIFSMLNVTGKFYMSNKELAKRLRCSKNTITNCVNELAKLGYILTSEIKDKDTGATKGREIRLAPNFLPHTTHCDGVEQPAVMPPNNELCGASTTDCDQIEQGKRASNTNDQSDRKVSEKQLEEDFEKLWKLYPKKVGKPQAFKAYKKFIKKKDVTNKKIQTGIVNYLKQISIQRTTKEYIKNGSTWFKEECWDDEYNLGASQAPVNPKEKTGDAPRPRSREEEKLEARKQSAEAFLYNLREHLEYFESEHMKAAINDFVTKNPELKEEVLEIARTRGKSDRNTA